MIAFTPDNYKEYYEFDLQKKTFQQFKRKESERNLLPQLIRIELNNGFNSITGANILLRIRDTTNWKRCSITGLRPTGTKGYYYGDLKIRGVKSLVVVRMDGKVIEIRVCSMFYPKVKGQLLNIIKNIINKF